MISVRRIVKFRPVTPQSRRRVPGVPARILARRAASVAAGGVLHAAVDERVLNGELRGPSTLDDAAVQIGVLEHEPAARPTDDQCPAVDHLGVDHDIRGVDRARARVGLHRACGSVRAGVCGAGEAAAVSVRPVRHVRCCGRAARRRCRRRVRHGDRHVDCGSHVASGVIGARAERVGAVRDRGGVDRDRVRRRGVLPVYHSVTQKLDLRHADIVRCVDRLVDRCAHGCPVRWCRRSNRGSQRIGGNVGDGDRHVGGCPDVACRVIGARAERVGAVRDRGGVDRDRVRRRGVLPDHGAVTEELDSGHTDVVRGTCRLVHVPVTVEPFAGAVTDAVGAVVSTGAGQSRVATITVDLGEEFPEPSNASTASV